MKIFFPCISVVITVLPTDLELRSAQPISETSGGLATWWSKICCGKTGQYWTVYQ